MRISYSALDTFRRCPLKFKFQYIDKIKTPKSKEALFGTLLHNALKILHEPGLIVPTVDDILKYIADNWNIAAYPTEQESAMAFAQAIKIMRDYCAQNNPAQFNIVALETAFEIPLKIDGDDYRVTGKIDRVDKTADGLFEIIDYKTAKKMPAQEKIENDLQLSIYHLGVISRWPSLTEQNRPVKVSLYFLKHGEKLSSVRIPAQVAATRENIIKNLEQIKLAQQNQKFQPTPNALCDWCEFQKNCPYFKHKFREEKLFFNNQEIEALVDECLKLNAEIDTRDKRLKEVKAEMSKFMDQEGLERIFGQDGYLTRQLIQRFKYDSEVVRQILEPLGQWPNALKIDDAKLKKIIASLPRAEQIRLETARQVCKEFKTITLKKQSKKIKPALDLS